MKNTLKYFLVLAVAAVSALSCKDELIPSKDTYADYKGVVGDFAYIVGGTMSEYDAVTAEIQHTPIGEIGTLEKNFTVALTKAQPEDVTVTVDVDNTSLTGINSAFPEGVLKFNGSVTIPAGELQAEVAVTADNSDFPKLVDPQYMAVFRIADVTGGVKVSTNSNKAVLYATVETIDPADNVVSIAGNTVTFNVTNYTDTQRGDNISTSIAVTGTDEAFQQFDVTFAVDNSLIAAYNEENGTSYVAVPDGIVSIVNATMAKDAKSASGSVSISNDDRAQLTDANGYLVPVRIDDVADATLSSNSGVVWIVIKVVNFDTPSNMFSALYLGDYNMATWYKFPQGLSLSNGYTYVFHVFIDEITAHSRIGNFADANEGWINMLRYGERGNNDTRLEWWVGPGSCRKKLYAKAIEAQKWYQYALVYDKNSYKFYLEGELVDEVTLTDDEKAILQAAPPVFQAIEFNSSWVAGYRPGNEFHGRFWNFSVWQTALDADDISQCYRGMTPAYQNYMNWYGAYWAFDDVYGYVVKQTAGKTMGDIDFSRTTRVEDEGRGTYEDADVSQYIQWKTDEFNRFE
ncbi:MAG: DUF1735 domain-containing protein [Bacteroidales bacterium]|nr:DUF1735 domain-containing protein [Bacteroidales bacterium]